MFNRVHRKHAKEKLLRNSRNTKTRLFIQASEEDFGDKKFIVDSFDLYK